VWTCDDDHLVAGSAQRCAQAELARRARVQGTVLVLLRCEPCESWFGNVAGVTACPRCGVPLERVTAVVTGRQPAA
jgi:rRNA maturation endonuclease Nob1